MTTLTIPKLVEIPEEPTWEFTTIDDVFMKQISMPFSGYVVGQHSHDHDHGTLLARGSVRVWKSGGFDADYTAPTCIQIAAGIKHTFMALENDTLLYCIHNVSRTGEVEIREKATFPG